MADTVPNRITEIFQRWQTALKPTCKNNISMDTTQIVAKFPGAVMTYMGAPQSAGDLEGDEAAITVSIQIDIYTKGQKALSQAFTIDEASHKTLQSMGFRRTYGAEPTVNADNTIKRLTSRYSLFLDATGLLD